MEAIKELFDTLDISKTGRLSMDELRDVVAFYEGSEFDEASFLRWYDTNHAIQLERLGAARLDQVGAAASTDGELDLTEFAWYLVEAAHCDAAEMEKTVESFTEAVEYIAAKKAQALKVWDHF
jgi:Ca2+-binding EF-hand superfamily protein